MSSWALHQVVFERLTTFSALGDLIDARVYDAPPKDAAYPFVSFGPMDSVPEDMECIDAETQTFQLDVWSSAQDGQRECKLICDQIKKAFHKWTDEPAVGALVIARVVLTRILPDPQQALTHGVVQVEFDIEGA